MTKITTIGNCPTLVESLPALPHSAQFHALFTSPEAWASHVEAIDQSKTWDDVAWAAGSFRKEFTGTHDMPEAIQTAREGWPEGAARVAALRDKINAANPMGPRVIRWDVAGAVASVPRALAGNPLNMRRVDTARLRRRPIITLVSELGLSCSVDSTALVNRAAACGAIVDAIETAGFSCAVVATCDMHTRADYDGPARKFAGRAACVIKEAGAQCDVGRLAFGIGHPSVFRRLGFAIYCEAPQCNPLTGCMGYPIKAVDVDGLNARGVFYLPKLGERQGAGFIKQSEFRDDETTITRGLPAMIAELQRQGCPAFPTEHNAAA